MLRGGLRGRRYASRYLSSLPDETDPNPEIALAVWRVPTISSVA
jgi:hypothetical protein